jgi:phosphoribosyl 1,2-cyclic phosphodiesterase
VSSAETAIRSHRQEDASVLSVTFCGVRGSAPVSGPEFAAFGGSTMCIDVETGSNRIIIDAGSGIQKLGRVLRQLDVRSIDILLTHYHLDHVLGLMSFAPLFHKGTTVTIHAPVLTDEPPHVFLPRLFDPPFFPMRLGDAGSRLEIRHFSPGERFALQGLEIRSIHLSHPGGACGYRVDDGEASVVVIADHEHGSREHDRALAEFCARADLLLYDSHWDEDRNYPAHRGWGHSTWQAGLRLAQAAGARRLGCIHHAPEATDTELLARESRLRAAHDGSFFAREGESERVAALRG